MKKILIMILSSLLLIYSVNAKINYDELIEESVTYNQVSEEEGRPIIT